MFCLPNEVCHVRSPKWLSRFAFFNDDLLSTKITFFKLSIEFSLVMIKLYIWHNDFLSAKSNALLSAKIYALSAKIAFQKIEERRRTQQKKNIISIVKMNTKIFFSSLG